MSYVNDPVELAYPPVLEDKNIESEEPRDYHEFFYDDLPYSFSRSVDHETGIHTDVCRFDDSGNHVLISGKCPHFDIEDEEGKIVKPGWTVQQNARN